MGYMTNITILNDAFDWIDKNPKTFVKAIKYGMNSGTDEEMWFRDRPDFRSDEEREADRNYVTVHKAQHADDAQIIYSEANMAFPVHELAFGRAERWINRAGSGSSNAKTRISILRKVVRQLRWYADQLDQAIDAVEKETP